MVLAEDDYMENYTTVMTDYILRDIKNVIRSTASINEKKVKKFIKSPRKKECRLKYRGKTYFILSRRKQVDKNNIFVAYIHKKLINDLKIALMPHINKSGLTDDTFGFVICAVLNSKLQLYNQGSPLWYIFENRDILIANPNESHFLSNLWVFKMLM